MIRVDAGECFVGSSENEGVIFEVSILLVAQESGCVFTCCKLRKALVLEWQK